MKQVLLLLAFLIPGAISQPVYAYQDAVCHVMTSDSISLYVHVKGEGPMCLYLHGGPGSGSTWMEAVSGHMLEKRFTMVYLDQRGVCKSETPKNDDFSFARQIQDWEEVRQALGIDHWLLMGHSWGGILMMGYWKAHPNVIDGMMFINCTLSRDTSFEESWLPRAISILGDTASPVAKDESRPLKERMMAVFPQLNDDNRWMLFTPNKWANDSIGSWRFHKDCISHGKGETPLFMDEYGEDFRPLTSAVKVPVLYLYGRQDYAVGPEHYKTLHFPNAIIQGADCGHIVFLEEPAVFAEALEKFCQLLLTPINDSTKLSKEQVLAHVDELKRLVDEKIWPTYNDPTYSMEMNYYEEGPFRMHLVQAGANTEARMECSSPEITMQAVPSVKTYEEWYAMLVHECFHGFQYKHTAFWNKMMASTPEDFVTSDSLKALKQNYEWYRDMLSKENALLKKAYEASDIHEVRQILAGFYSIRNERLKAVKDRLGLDITEFYPIIETMEGSARYIEYRLAREQGITDTDWMTNLDNNSYYYASGLYLMLIMDKFGIPYKDELFLKYFTLTELFQDISKQDCLLQDYDYFFSQLEQIHPDPYSAFGGKNGFDKAVKQVKYELANRDSLTLNEMQVEVTKLISALHDGHTYIGYDKAQKKVEDQWVPLKFKVIPNGIIVNGYTPELESLKGAMLCEVEGEPLESVLDRLDKLVVSENRYGLMGKACTRIGNANVLRQLFPTFNKEQVSMKFRMANGKDTLVSLPFYPNGPFWENIVWTSTDERFPHNNFEYRFVDDCKQTMVMCINSVVSADIPNLESYGLKSDVIVADVFAKMLREMKAVNSPRLIIDLRGNGGGWTMIMYAALYELYGKRFMDTDLGMHSATKVSDGWLKKNNLTLEQLNQDRGTLLKMGDFIERPSNISNFDWFMCADMSILEAQDGEPIYTPKEIYVVTDVQTFSSAFHTAYMLWKMGAKVVGVTSGQAPNTFMEVTRFKLPNTGLECSASNSLQSCFPTDHPMAKTFTPDIQLSYDDYRQFDFSKDAELLFIEKLSK